MVEHTVELKDEFETDTVAKGSPGSCLSGAAFNKTIAVASVCRYQPSLDFWFF